MFWLLLAHVSCGVGNVRGRTPVIGFTAVAELVDAKHVVPLLLLTWVKVYACSRAVIARTSLLAAVHFSIAFMTFPWR